MAAPARSARLQAVPVATATQPARIALDEAERVLLWRITRLVEAGYCAECAVELGCATVDLHAAVDLVERGCPAELALRILL